MGNKGSTPTYTVKSTFTISVETQLFTLINVRDQVFLISSGDFLEMMLLDLESSSVTSMSPLNMQLNNVRRQPSLVGEKSKFYGETNSGTIMFFEYAGLDGVRVAETLKPGGVIASATNILLTKDDV